MTLGRKVKVKQSFLVTEGGQKALKFAWCHSWTTPRRQQQSGFPVLKLISTFLASYAIIMITAFLVDAFGHFTTIIIQPNL